MAGILADPTIRLVWTVVVLNNVASESKLDNPRDASLLTGLVTLEAIEQN